MEKVVLVLGYNNVRINDVKKISCAASYVVSARTILCKEKPSIEDKRVCDGTIDVDLTGGEEAVAQILMACQNANWRVIGILPFSDKGTQLGAHLSQQMMLKGPDLNKVAAALDKYTFRQYEAAAVKLPLDYRRIRAMQVRNKKTLKTLYQKWGGKLFIKPMREGNSRGCQIIDSQKSCAAAWAALIPYQRDGIMVEELVEAAEEYSWDAVGSSVWITEKKTTNSHYRAEIQQIVPARLGSKKYAQLMNAGFFMAQLAGARGGACHNEIFYDPKTREVMAVEPNLRPAGMRIWDLAALAHKNFNPWREWITWATHRLKPLQSKSLRFRAYAGIRMIQSFQTGIIQEIPLFDCSEILKIKPPSVEIIEGQWTCAEGDTVNADVQDNAGFLGYIIARCKHYDTLVKFLQNATQLQAERVVIV